jgi:hypothetical protein
MAGIENAPDIEIIDNEKVISEKITNCESNCKSNLAKKEWLQLLNTYDAQLENHDIDLAFNKSDNTFRIICDTVVLVTPLDINSLERVLSNIVRYIELWEEKSFTNLWGLYKWYDLIWNKQERILVKSWIWWTTVRDQISLNKNSKSQNEDIKRRDNNISEDMYVFLQNILNPDWNWKVDGVCEWEWVTKECIDTLGSWTDDVIVNKIKNIREATSEDIKKFN